MPCHRKPGHRKPAKLPAGAPGRPEKSRYKEQYGVIVICDDQAHQQAVYAALKDRYTVRVVVT